MRFYLRLGFMMGVPFGVFMALWALLVERTPSLASFVLIVVVSGGLFGTLMAAILGTLHRRATRGQQTTSGSSSADTVVLPIAVEFARDLCGDAAKALPNAKLKEASERHVRIAVGASLKSWGERIELHLSACADHTTAVAITSRSTVRTTMIDFGRNHDNVRRIATWLEDQAAARTG